MESLNSGLFVLGHYLGLGNGSPIAEFNMQKGLRQGDSFSRFLFLLAAEALHVMRLEARENGIFKGAPIGDNAIEISHLQFADDVLFFGELSVKNALNLLKCLKWFGPGSGLRINLTKSCLFGVGVSWEAVSSLASSVVVARVNCHLFISAFRLELT